MHRVRAGSGRGRYSVPFFFKPGEGCALRCADEDGTGDGIVYGEHFRGQNEDVGGVDSGYDSECVGETWGRSEDR
jgi:hypothetical protein